MRWHISKVMSLSLACCSNDSYFIMDSKHPKSSGISFANHILLLSTNWTCAPLKPKRTRPSHSALNISLPCQFTRGFDWAQTNAKQLLQTAAFSHTESGRKAGRRGRASTDTPLYDTGEPAQSKGLRKWSRISQGTQLTVAANSGPLPRAIVFIVASLPLRVEGDRGWLG